MLKTVIAFTLLFPSQVALSQAQSITHSEKLIQEIGKNLIVATVATVATGNNPRAVLFAQNASGTSTEAQSDSQTPPIPPTATTEPSSSQMPANQSSSTTASNPQGIAHFYVFGLGLGLGAGGAATWKFHQTWTGKFSRVNEGWFGNDTYAGGSDKLGHFYTDFVLVRALNEIYRSHGFDNDSSIKYAFLGSMTIRTLMEVADGFTTFLFSAEDLIANTLGSVASAALLHHPEIDEAISVSWTYAPSQEKLDGKVEPSSIDNDYNGSIYHLDLKLKGLMNLLKSNIDSLDDYAVSLSYYTRGYDRDREDKHRMLSLTFGVAIEETIENHLSETNMLQSTKTFFKYFKVPFTFFGVVYDLDTKRSGFRYGLNYFY